MFSADISHAALQNGKVQVATSKGESSLTDPKSVKEVAVTGKLFEQGYKVETTKDSTVELCLSNGSTLLLNPETLIEVRTFRQVASNLIVEGSYQKLEKEPSPSVVEIQVVKGKIIGEVRKLNPQSSFTIKTPAGVARIRGTVYTVEYNENKSNKSGNMEVSCIKGSVEVTVNGSNSGPTPVEPGKKMIAQAPIVEAGIQITPVLDFEPLPFFTPTINITKPGSE
jgi:ferric-dicitrate binding protein FerR (iron transport regulator)